MTDWELTEESFNLFLSWLSKDRDVAGKKHEDIRRRLSSCSTRAGARERLVKAMGIAGNALRIEVHCIRTALEFA